MKHADFTDDIHLPGTCREWCKVHWWWSFEADDHRPYPQERYWKQDNGWAHVKVWVGPPGYNPKKPNDDQWNSMRMVCPHEQMDLTCNTCLRHMFRPLEV
jgi:hypothetical protein